MAKAPHEPGALSGCFTLLGLIAVVYAFTIHWGLGVGTLVVVVAIVGALTHSGKCDICGVKLKRKSYRWNDEGKSVLACPNCNRKLEKEQSDKGFEKFKRR